MPAGQIEKLTTLLESVPGSYPAFVKVVSHDCNKWGITDKMIEYIESTDNQNVSDIGIRLQYMKIEAGWNTGII